MSVWWLVGAFAVGGFTTLFLLGATLQWGIENEIKRAKQHKTLS
jgi:hypothetical protein